MCIRDSLKRVKDRLGPVGRLRHPKRRAVAARGEHLTHGARGDGETVARRARGRLHVPRVGGGVVELHRGEVALVAVRRLTQPAVATHCNQRALAHACEAKVVPVDADDARVGPVRLAADRVQLAAARDHSLRHARHVRRLDVDRDAEGCREAGRDGRLAPAKRVVSLQPEEVLRRAREAACRRRALGADIDAPPAVGRPQVDPVE
eukprot:3413597-Prymnesium_polylepis.5